MKLLHPSIILLTVAAWLSSGSLQADSKDFVDAGKSLAVRAQGTLWETGSGYGTGDGYLQCTGQQNFLFADSLLGAGDFVIKARLSVEPLDKTGASFELGSAQFGFDGPTNGQLWIKDGTPDAKNKCLGKADKFITSGKPFDFEAARKGDRLRITIDGKEVYAGPFTSGVLGKVGFRPWRSSMRVYDFSANGNLEPWKTVVAETIKLDNDRIEVRPENPPAGLKTLADFGLMTNEAINVQYVTRSRTYENRCTLTPNGDLLFMAAMGQHYGPPGGAYGKKLNKMVMCRSIDGGKTWSEPALPWEVPYAQHGFIPLIPRDGKRIYCFGTEPKVEEREGRENATIAFRYSDDDGKTWSEPNFIRPINDPTYKGMSVMRMCETDDGTWLLGTHTGEWEPNAEATMEEWRRNKTGKLHTRLYVLRSTDKGKTWTLLPGKRPDGWVAPDYSRMEEGRVINLGKGKELLLARTPEGHLWKLLSNDDGLTWSDPKPTPLIQPDAPPMLFHLSDGKTLIALHHNKYDPSQPHFNSRWGRNELWFATSKDEGETWSEPRFIVADVFAGDRRAISYADLVVNGDTLNLFISPNWENALHLQFKESDLKKFPTAKELKAGAK